MNDSVLHKYEQARMVTERISREKSEATKKVDGLYAKQGRGKQFETEEEREEFLRSQIAELNVTVAEKSDVISSMEEGVVSLSRSQEKMRPFERKPLTLRRSLISLRN
ncbi:MAG: hypothetical protein ACREOZ_05040 [Gloeomargaritales cyanobacterium]